MNFYEVFGGVGLAFGKIRFGRDGFFLSCLFEMCDLNRYGTLRYSVGSAL